MIAVEMWTRIKVFLEPDYCACSCPNDAPPNSIGRLGMSTSRQAKDDKTTRRRVPDLFAAVLLNPGILHWLGPTAVGNPSSHKSATSRSTSRDPETTKKSNQSIPSHKASKLQRNLSSLDLLARILFLPATGDLQKIPELSFPRV